jgi:hypothetical protein
MKLTGTNLFALRTLFKSEPAANVFHDAITYLDRVPNQIRSVSVPHIRRCLALGLVELSADKKELSLTATGRAACEGGAQ